MPILFEAYFLLQQRIRHFTVNQHRSLKRLKVYYLKFYLHTMEAYARNSFVILNNL